MDDAVLARIDIKKRKFLDVKADSAAMRRAKKEAYFQYIYHTVGIEGNTLGGVGCRPNLLGRGGGRVRPSPCGSDWLFLMLARFISQLAIHSQSAYHR